MKKKVEYFREVEEVNDTFVEATVPSVNIRKEPGYNGAIIATATEGQKLKHYSTIVDPDGVSWHEVGAEGNHGWICGKFSRLVE